MAQSEDTKPSSMKEHSEKQVITTIETLCNDTDEITEINDTEIIDHRNESMIEDETMPSLESIESFSCSVISSKQEKFQINDKNKYNEDDKIQTLHQNDNRKRVITPDNASDDNVLKMTRTSKCLIPPLLTMKSVASVSALSVKPIRQEELRKSVSLNHNLNSNNEETVYVDVPSESDSNSESQENSENGRRSDYDDDEDNDYADNDEDDYDDDYYDEKKRSESNSDELDHCIEENRSDDTDVDDSYKHDQASYDCSLRHNSLESSVNVEQRSKSFPNLSNRKEAQSYSNKRKFDTFQQDITSNGKEKHQVDPIGLNSDNENDHDIQSDGDIKMHTKKYKQDIEYKRDEQQESDELNIHKALQNNFHKKKREHRNDTLEKETDVDIIIEDQSTIDNRAVSISTTIPCKVDKNLQIFTTETATHQQYMQGNNNTVVTSTTKNYTNNINNAQEIEEIAIETDAIIPQSQLPIEFKIDNVMSLGLQTTNNEIVVSSDDCLILKSQIEQLKQENEELKKSLINIETDHEKFLIDLTQKYTTEMDQNKKLTNELNKLQKLLAETEKSKAIVSHEKTTMTENFFQAQCSSEIEKNPKISTSSLNQTAESSGHVSLGPTEQWPSQNNCGSPIISAKYPNVDGILNSTDNSFVTSDPSKMMHKSLSNAFFTSSRILETLASITQGRNDPNILNAEIEISNRNNVRNGSSADISNNIADITSRLQGDGKGRFNIAACPIERNRSDDKFISRKRKAQSSETYEHDSSIADGDVDHIHKHGNKTIIDQKEEITVGDGIKCFVYQDDDDSDERSFLIQAEEPLQVANSKEVVRECGPFMLKNIEVRMSEVNGTINIWGKEIKTNSSAQEIDENNGDLEENVGEEEEVDDEYTLELNNEHGIWRKTSCKRKSNTLLESINKKKIPPIARTSPTTIQCRSPRDLPDQLHYNCHHQPHNSINHFGSMPNLNRHASPYAHQQQQQQRVYPQMCESIFNSQSKFSCQHQNCQDCKFNKTRVGCLCDNETDNMITTNVSCEDFNQTKDACHSLSSHRSSNLPYTCLKTNHHYRASPNESLFLGDNNPLIHSQRSSPLSDAKRRHLRGKKVRGILMDFLKSCGPCKNPHTTTQDDQQYQKAEEMLAPDIHITSADSVVGANKRFENHTNVPASPGKKCCNNSYTKRVNIADLEKQIQIFQEDMEKMQSRSNVFLNMLHVLHGIDSS